MLILRLIITKQERETSTKQLMLREDFYCDSQNNMFQGLTMIYFVILSIHLTHVEHTHTHKTPHILYFSHSWFETSPKQLSDKKLT